MIFRGTTPTLTFNLPFSVSRVTYGQIAFWQDDEVLFVRDTNGAALAGERIVLTLTEGETMKLDDNGPTVSMQMRIVSGEKILSSCVMQDVVGRLLDESLLSGYMQSVPVEMNQAVSYDVKFPEQDGEKAVSFGLLRESAGSGGMFYDIGYGLKVIDNVLMVDAAQEVEQDNTLPITSSAVYATVGNINALLETI